MHAFYLPSYFIQTGFFSSTECDALIALSEQSHSTLATLNGTDNPDEILKFRHSYTTFIYKSNQIKNIFENLDQKIFAINNENFGFDIDCLTYYQYTLYNEDGFFEWHRDLIFNSYNQKRDSKMRKLSISVLLNDEFEGGDFIINNGNQQKALPINLKKGDAIIFPSFISHKVSKITNGTRKSLVAWYTGERFK